MKLTKLENTDMNPKSKSFLNSRSVAFIIGVCLTAQIVLAQEGLYEKGQTQLDNKEYQAARDTFAHIVETDDAKQDAALYWLAYSQFKNGHDKEALNTISRLTREHSNSRWLDDAAALKVEIQDESGESFDVDNEEMKLYALNSLMNSPSEKSIGILRRLLAGNSSDQIKHRALFVLSQIDDPEAIELIASLAKNGASKQLQDQAIRMLGISGSEQAVALLTDVYRSSDDEDIKSKILHSYMVSDQSGQLIELAKTESNPNLKRQAIRLIGVMSNSDVLLEMYRSDEFKDFRSEILHGIAIGDGTRALLEVVKFEKDQQLLTEAVRTLGISGDEETGGYLADIYQNNDDREIRRAVVQALFLQSNAEELAKIVKTEKDAGLKREALQKLSIMGSDESLEFFNNILEDEG